MTDTTPAYWVGVVSYSVYLLQVPLIVLKEQSRLTASLQDFLRNPAWRRTRRAGWLISISCF